MMLQCKACGTTFSMAKQTAPGNIECPSCGNSRRQPITGLTVLSHH